MKKLELLICEKVNAKSVIRSSSIQNLWGGYGEIKRYFLKGGNISSVIVKHIRLSEVSNHPRGWNTIRSHQRKLKSYQVESEWYQKYTNNISDNCRVPECYFVDQTADELLLIMEDLDAQGYSIRLEPTSITLTDAKNCLYWLANFHAGFIQVDPIGLWDIGTYWHLKTRPDEWANMSSEELKQAAKAIDNRLNKAVFQTIVHGDAKLANFCFSDNHKVAAVDFQYVGKGCGMKDVAYFISSCYEDDQCSKYENELLNHYFKSLEIALNKQVDFEELKKEWTSLYKYAWADFYRFLDGWSPGHWKMHGYSERMVSQVIKELRE